MLRAAVKGEASFVFWNAVDPSMEAPSETSCFARSRKQMERFTCVAHHDHWCSSLGHLMPSSPSARSASGARDASSYDEDSALSSVGEVRDNDFAEL